MLNELENEILAVFLRNPSEPYTVYGLAKSLGRYVSQVQLAVKSLTQKNILSVKKLGSRTSQCLINFSTADTNTLSVASINAKTIFLKKNLKIKIICSELEKKLAGEIYILLLFGSYAKEKESKNSDIDLCFITQEEPHAEKLKAEVKAALSSLSYKIHVNVFTAEWFYKMLKEKDTVGREAFKASITLHGHDSYYELVKKYDQETGYSESNSII